MIRVTTPLGRAVKRFLDIAFSLVGLLLLLPVMLLVAVAVRLDGPGPVFFRQERVGRGGEIFRIWKFRTMEPQAESQGPSITVAGDRRVTRVGRWLRRWKLDELPQLMNVFAGSMSLVGPRPEVARFVTLYDEEQRGVLAFRPGITDPATLAYLGEEDILDGVADWELYYESTVIPDKIAANLQYMSTATITSDLALLVRTVLRILYSPEGKHDWLPSGQAQVQEESR